MEPIARNSQHSVEPTTDRTTLTYAALLEHGAKHLEAEGLSPQPIANLCSALRLWQRVHGFTGGRLVHDDFDGSFNRLLTQFSDGIADSLSTRTQRDRQEQLIRWRHIAQLLRRVDALPTAFPEALRVAVHTTGHSPRQVARESGIAISTFSNWIAGTVLPRGQTVSQIPVLEKVLSLPPGTLMRRLPAVRRRPYERTAGAPKRQPRQQGAPAARRQKLVHPYSGRLVHEWSELLSFKSDDMRAGANPHNTWRLKEVSKTAFRIQPWMLHGTLACATAGVQWGICASYLGWLGRPKPNGGGVPASELDTLAWLVDAERVIQYAKWMRNRAGKKLHNGIKVMLQSFTSYLRPKSGFLWLTPSFRHKLAAVDVAHCPWIADVGSDDAWRIHCETARRQMLDHLQLMFGGKDGDKKVEYSRCPTRRASVVLNSEAPLRALVAFEEELESSPPPPAHHRDYIAWLRDVVLVKLMIRNPLRSETYGAMTFLPDGSGNLIRTGADTYMFSFPPEAFKNQKGAAYKPYRVAVDASVGPWISRYLAEARPHLQYVDESSRFFLPAAKGPRKEQQHLLDAGVKQERTLGEALSDRLQVLTGRFIDGCPGFGSHAFRHIIATDHLKRHPGDYLTVASLLHDTLETVLKNYSHVEVDHSLRSLARDIASFRGELASQRAAAL